MTDDQFQEMMAQTKVLEQSGNHEEAIRMLKTMADGAPDVEDRMLAAGLICSIVNFNYQHLLTPETSQYAEVHKYLRIALESYDRSHPSAQELFRQAKNDVPGMRQALSSMDQGKPFVNSKKAGCFIATAAYDSSLAPEVLIFRRFRDQVLLTSRVGSLFVKVYYFVSPSLASVISEVDLLKKATRHLILAPLLRLLKNKNAKVDG